MIILPGYCVPGTVGAKVLQGDKVIEFNRFQKLEIKIQVQNLSFSAHADAKGIMQLIRMCKAKNVMLVHGEAYKMELLKMRIESELGVPTVFPPNGVTVTIQTNPSVPVLINHDLIVKSHESQLKDVDLDKFNHINSCSIQGDLVLNKTPTGNFLSLVPQKESRGTPLKFMIRLRKPFHMFSPLVKNPHLSSKSDVLKCAMSMVQEAIEKWTHLPVMTMDDTLNIDHQVYIQGKHQEFIIAWNQDAFDLATQIVTIVSSIG